MRILGNFLLVVLMLAGVMVIVGCGGGDDESPSPHRRVFPQEPYPSFIPNSPPSGTGVYFRDSNLESVLLEATGKPAGDIASSDLAQLTELDASNKRIFALMGWNTVRLLPGSASRQIASAISRPFPVSGALRISTWVPTRSWI